MAIESESWLIFISALFGYLAGIISTFIAQHYENKRFIKQLDEQRTLLFHEKMLDKKIEIGHNIIREIAQFMTDAEDYLYRLIEGCEIEQKLLAYKKAGEIPPEDIIDDFAILIDTRSSVDEPLSEIRRRCRENPDKERILYSDNLSKHLKNMRDRAKQNRLLVHGWSLYLDYDDPSIKVDYEKLFNKISIIPNILVDDKEIKYQVATPEQRQQWRDGISKESFLLSNKIRKAIQRPILR